MAWAHVGMAELSALLFIQTRFAETSQVHIGLMYDALPESDARSILWRAAVAVLSGGNVDLELVPDWFNLVKRFKSGSEIQN